MTERISRKPHHLPPEAYLGQVRISFTACIDQGIRVFQDAEIVHVFLDILTAAVAKYECVVPVYTFMPEHCHFIIVGVNETSTSWNAIRDFKQRTGYWLSSHSNARWQKDFYDHVIRKSDDLKHQIRYIVNNPVRRGLVSNWDDYPFTGSIGADLKEVLSDIQEN